MLKIGKLIAILVFTTIIVIANVSSLTDSNPSNNVKSINVTVVETKKLNLTFIPIDNPDNFDGNVEDFVEFFNLTYPISNGGLLVSKGQSYTSSPEEKSNLGRLLFNIGKKGLLSYKKRTVGIVPKYWFKNFTSLSDALGYARVQHSVGFFPSGLVEAREIRQIAAHEIGHTYGLCDEYSPSNWSYQNKILGLPGFCPNADTDDNEILDANCEGEGCPTSTIGKLVPWNNSNDSISLTNLMGTNDQDKVWISNESYVHLLSKFQKLPIIVQTALIVNGIINKTSGTIELFTSYIIENAEITQQEENTTGNYSIEIIDNSGIVTSKINFTPSFLDIGFNGSTVETNISYFVVVMNFSSNDKGVKAKENDAVKDEVNRTANSPTLNLTFPLGGELVSNKMNIIYNASDADGDTIDYAILISSDNGNIFSTLEIDHPNQTLSVNTSSLTEGKQYKVKVLATDGINTNNTVSENTFEIDNDLRITNLSTLHQNATRRTFFYKTKNTLDTSLDNIQEELNTDESTIQLSSNHSLNSQEDIMVFIEYDYNTTGDKTLTATATSGTYIETESASVENFEKRPFLK